MSVETQINRIKANIASAYAKAAEKGAQLPEVRNSENLPAAIEAIPAGGLPEGVRTITVTADPPEGGSVSGGGVASVGMTVIASAEAVASYNFMGWKEDGAAVSAENEYAFLVEADRSLIALFEAKKGHDLPVGYKECVYLVPAVGSCIYFSTGLYSTTKVYVDVEVDPSKLVSPYTSFYFFDASTYWGSSTTTVFAFSLSCQIYSSSGKLHLNGIRGTRLSTASASTTSRDLAIPVPKGRVIAGLDNVLGGANVNDQLETFGNSNGTTTMLYLFNDRDSRTTKLPFEKIYGAKIYKGDEVLHDLIPCANPSNVAGFYDIVENKFYSDNNYPFAAGPYLS